MEGEKEKKKVFVHTYPKGGGGTQCLLAPTGGVSNPHKSTIDTDSSVDPVPCT